MRFTAAHKVVATGAAALGVVLGAAGITAAATNSVTDPAQQQPVATQQTGDHTPANEQGKAEPADSANEAPDTAASENAEGPETPEAPDTAASEKAEGPEAADPTDKDTKDTADTPDPAPTVGTPATAGHV